MKRIHFIIFLSIFCVSYICKAQKPKFQISICNTTDSLIHFSEISKFTDCDKISYTDAAGNKLWLKNYVIAFSPKHGTAYYESVIGDKLTKSIKSKLQKLKPGDIIVITHVDDTKSTAAYKSGNASRIYKIID